MSIKPHSAIAVFVIMLTLAYVSSTPQAQAGDFAVVSVVRNFPMKSADETAKDYYINAGSNNGLRQGAFLDAMRKVAVHDNFNSKIIGDTPVPIARLKLIHVDKNMGIARMVQFFERSVTPYTGYDDVMVGDLIKVSQKQ